MQKKKEEKTIKVTMITLCGCIVLAKWHFLWTWSPFSEAAASFSNKPYVQTRQRNRQMLGSNANPCIASWVDFS